MDAEVFFATGRHKTIGAHADLSGLADDDHLQYPPIITGAGDPASTPARPGAIYVDTDNGIIYAAPSASAAADFSEAAATPVSDAQRNAIASPDTGLEIYNNEWGVKEAYDTQRWRALSDIGWTPRAYPLGFVWFVTGPNGIVLPANGGSVAIPIHMPGHMLLEQIKISNTDTASQRTWGWDLYLQPLNNGNGGENTLNRVAASNGDETFTPAVASLRTLAVASAPVYLRPGVYWLVVQCTHASNGFTVGCGPTGSGFAAALTFSKTKTTTNPNGATLDFVAATWTASAALVPIVELEGRVFGQTSVF